MATNPGRKAYAAQLVTGDSKGIKETIARGLTKGPALDSVLVNHQGEDRKDDIKDATAMLRAAKYAQVRALIERSMTELQEDLDRA